MSLRFIGLPHFVLATLLSPPSWAASPAIPRVVAAFSVWGGDGTLEKTGPDEATFTGSMTGTVYIETSGGPVAAGLAVCPMTLQVQIKEKAHRGDGKCTFTANDGANAYGDFHCAGYFLIGCSGEFKFTGGAARLTGIAGGGRMTIRTNVASLLHGVAETYSVKAGGIMFWPKLRVEISN